MAYAVVSDMTARFGEAEMIQLTYVASDGDDGPAVNAATIGLAIESASGQMDMYLGARQALPLTGLSTGQTADLTRLCCDIARYRLWDDRASDEVRARYEDAIRVMEMIATGKLTLIPDNMSSDTPASKIQTGTRTTIFTDSVWESFAQ